MGPCQCLKYLWLWFKLQMVGAWTILQEQIWDRHIVPTDLPKCESSSRKNIVITGGNRGIGLEAVKTFLRLGYHVIIGCRKPSQATDAISKLQQKGKLDADVSYEAHPLDLMSMQSVKEFAMSVNEMGNPIHVLANNAGIMFGPRRETSDGFESQLSTNYLGHFLLTSELLPLLRKAGSEGGEHARIVNVSSVAHYVGSDMDLEDLHCKNFYSPEGAYGNSKAAQVMFTKFLDQKLQSEGEPIRVHSVHPGVVNTGLYDDHAYFTRMVGFWLMKSAKQGGDSVTHASLSPELIGRGGTYIENTHVKTGSAFTQNQANQADLWAKTCKMLNIEEFGLKSK